MYIDINAAGCTNTCRHCSVDGHLPFGVLFSLPELRIIKNEWGPLTIRFEPTAHPDFPEIYQPDIAIEHGGWLVTNGFGIARRDDFEVVFEKMKQMGFHTIAFTFHGLRDHHDWFVCRVGAFDDIVLATRRCREAGFTTKWQIYLDRKGVADIHPFLDLAIKECGELPTLSLPYNRVGRRLWRYESMRLTLADLEAHKLNKVIEQPGKNVFMKSDELTSREWLKKWKQAPDSNDFKHPFEPRSWENKKSYEQLSLRIERDKKIYFDPLCYFPILLGNITEGKEVILKRLENLPPPPYIDIHPDDICLTTDEEEQLHPGGSSLRYREISKRLFC